MSLSSRQILIAKLQPPLQPASIQMKFDILRDDLVPEKSFFFIISIVKDLLPFILLFLILNFPYLFLYIVLYIVFGIIDFLVFSFFKFSYIS